jgi:hypothetical protein
LFASKKAMPAVDNAAFSLKRRRNEAVSCDILQEALHVT